MKIVAVCALLAGALASFHAQADVWSFVDDRGVAHFASSQLDPRYEVFFRGSSSLDAPAAARSAGVPADVSAATTKLINYMEASPGYQAAQPHLRAAAQSYQVDYALLQALIATESGFDATAVSPKGAVGLMQVIPDTAARYGVVSDRTGSVQKKLADPRTNIHTGTRYLRDLLQMFPGQLELALAAYNAGEGAVQKAGNRIPNFRETQNYVKTVMQLYAGLMPQGRQGQQATASGRGRTENHGAGYVTTLNPLAGATGRGNMVPPLVHIVGQPVAAAN